jgi:hypothetical protein
MLLAPRKSEPVLTFDRKAAVAGAVAVPLVPWDKMTIMMPGFSRPDIHVETVKFYCTMPLIHEIVIRWNNPVSWDSVMNHGLCSPG